jgi:Ca2+-binding RTX toxin-like protein
MAYRNLISGQYQIGNLVMGRGTTILVNEFDAQAYDINVQDYQVGMADETRFGQDQIKPTTIQMKMSVLYNELLDIYKHTNPNFWKEQPRIEHLATEWRADSIRKRAGEMMPFYFCGKDGEERILFGRPGQFSASKLSAQLQGQSVECVAEFRRADIYNYSISEYATELIKNANPSYITRTEGDAPAWLRIVATGPLTNPIFTIGESEIKITHNLLEGEVIEISSYPWQRRVVDSNRLNLASATTGAAAYLDRVLLPPYATTPVRWTADQLNTWVPELGQQSWEEDITSTLFFRLPSTFKTIIGRPIVGIDLFNNNERFLTSGLLIGNSSACMYTKKQYSTLNQYAEVRLSNLEAKGSSSVVIRSNDTMTNYAALEVVTTPSSRYLRIRSGTQPNAPGTQRAEFQNPNNWSSTDVISFKSTRDAATGVSTYFAYLNQKEVCKWVDTGKIVTDGKYQGFMFDTDGTILSRGQGFREILCYDIDVAASTKTGKVFLMWRNAWGSLP